MRARRGLTFDPNPQFPVFRASVPALTAGTVVAVDRHAGSVGFFVRFDATDDDASGQTHCVHWNELELLSRVGDRSVEQCCVPLCCEADRAAWRGGTSPQNSTVSSAS